MSNPYPPQPDEYGSVPERAAQPYVGAPDPYAYPPQPLGPQFVPVDPHAGQPSTGVNGLAIAALITAFLFPPLAIIFGHLALSQINSRNEGGRGLAVAGLVLGYLFTVLTIIGVIIAIVFLVVLAREFDDYRMRTAYDHPAVSTSVHALNAPTILYAKGFDDRGWSAGVVRLEF